MKKDFNLKHLVSVRVNNKQKSNLYYISGELTYRDWCNHWGRKITAKAGVYMDSFLSDDKFVCDVELFESSDISSTHIIIDGVIYIKHSVVLTFSNREEKIIYFNSVEEADLWQHNIMEKASTCGLWVNI